MDELEKRIEAARAAVVAARIESEAANAEYARAHDRQREATESHDRRLTEWGALLDKQVEAEMAARREAGAA